MSRRLASRCQCLVACLRSGQAHPAPIACQAAHLRHFATASGGSAAKGPVNMVSLGLTAATGCGILWYYNNVREEKLQGLHSKQSTVVGKAAIGGPFELLDQDGKPFTDKDLRGRFALLYFGFTFCPDICPEELEKMAHTIDLTEKITKKQVQPIFISIDPERDNVRQVKSYIREFHPRLIGLTGPLDKVKDAAKQYRVYYTKTNDSEEDYLVDHSIIMYLVDPRGDFVTFYGKNFTAEDMAKSIAEHIARWQENGQAT